MICDTNLPVALFNGTVATTNGLYSVQDIEVETAKQYIDKHGFVSAVGHKATAEIMSDLLKRQIPMQRIQFYQKVGQVAIVLKLNTRPPEGVVMDRQQMEEIG